MLLLMTYCGYLIQHYPIFQMIWPTMERRLKGSHPCVSHTANYTFRYVTVIMSFFFAYTIPNLEEIIPIIGVTTGMLLAFVFPALLESVTFWEKWRKRVSTTAHNSHFTRFILEHTRAFTRKGLVSMIGAVDAWINLVKALVGVGVFALPVAFKKSGLW
ncbi:Amino acid transporter domain containing protein, partial [Trichostrongylus colubriformis]